MREKSRRLFFLFGIILIGFLSACDLSGLSDTVQALMHGNASEEQAETYGEAADALEGSSGLAVRFIDVGQGDASLIGCDGHYMLIDGGDRSQSGKLYSILKDEGIGYLDYVVATHADADHVGGLSGALEYADFGTAYSSVTEDESASFNAFRERVERAGRSIVIPEAGECFSLGTAVCTVISPTAAGASSDNTSVVIRICYGDTSFLFTGDTETADERAMLASGSDMTATVLKIAHHGSRDSTGDAFLQAVKPSFSVISVGAENTYGHPAEEVLSRLKKTGIKLYRTDLQGNILAFSDGKTVTFSTERNENADVFSLTGKQEAQAVEILPDSGYVLNTNSGKFHRPSCDAVRKMSEKNKRYVTETKDELIRAGYSPCGSCKP